MRLYAKTIIATISFTLATTSVKAGDFEDSVWAIGVQGEFNFSSKFNDKAWKGKTGNNAQIFVDRKLDELFFIRAGFGYSTKGATHNSTVNEVSGDNPSAKKQTHTRSRLSPCTTQHWYAHRV